MLQYPILQCRSVAVSCITVQLCGSILYYSAEVWQYPVLKCRCGSILYYSAEMWQYTVLQCRSVLYNSAEVWQYPVLQCRSVAVSCITVQKCGSILDYSAEVVVIVIVIVTAVRHAARPNSSNQLLGQTFRPISSNQLLANYFSIHSQHSEKEGRQGRIE